MNSQTKVILGILVVILVLAGILGLKIIGVIKPAEKNKVVEETTSKLENVENIEIEKETNLDKKETILIEYDSKNNIDNKVSRKLHFNVQGLLGWCLLFYVKYRIVFFIITIILNIGIAILYSKISMPVWTIVLQIASPILSLLNMPPFIILIISILKFVSIIVLLKLLDAYSIELRDNKELFIAVSVVVLTVSLFVSKFNIIGIASTMVSLFVVVLILMFHIKMSLNLAELFNKGKGFKIGLILLPGVFQAILGYQKD